MKFSWKIAALVLSLAVICGAAFAWKFYEKRKADELKFVEAAKICRIGAEHGDAQAQYKLGDMFYHGQGVPQDYAEAVRWLRKSADQGNAKGEGALASMYSSGRGVQKDYNEALMWYRKAADQNNARSLYCIGYMYYYGEGVPQDNAEAARWYRKAAELGNVYAQSNLGYLYYYGYGVQRDRAEAERWYHMAADQGDEYAQRALGMRMPMPNTYCKISLIVALLGGILLLFGSRSTKQSINKQQQRISTLMATLLLFYIGLNIFGIFCVGVFHSIVAVNILYFVKDIICGILPVIFFSVMLPKNVCPKTAKIALGIFGLSFILFNALMISLYFKSHIARVFRSFSMGNGFLIGFSIPLIVYLWKTHHNSSDNKNGDEDVTTHENAAEDECESNPENEERRDADENNLRKNRW